MLLVLFQCILRPTLLGVAYDNPSVVVSNGEERAHPAWAKHILTMFHFAIADFELTHLLAAGCVKDRHGGILLYQQEPLGRRGSEEVVGARVLIGLKLPDFLATFCVPCGGRGKRLMFQNRIQSSRWLGRPKTLQTDADGQAVVILPQSRGWISPIRQRWKTTRHWRVETSIKPTVPTPAMSSAGRPEKNQS